MPKISIAAAFLIAGVFAAFGPAPDAWVYDRAAIEQGEYWRWLSAHLVHTDAGHLAWNVIGLLAVGGLFEASLGWRLVTGALAAMVCIDLYLAVVSPLDRYCGLSGALNGCLVAGALCSVRHSRDRLLCHLVILLSLGKILFESFTQAAVFTDTSWPAVPPVHLAGWLGGGAYACWRRPGSRDASANRALENAARFTVQPATKPADSKTVAARKVCCNLTSFCE